MSLKKIHPEEAQLRLYSLNPSARQEIIHDAPDIFHGYPILGQVEIESATERKILWGAFIQGIKESNGITLNCFEPRHGLRIIQNRSKTDFVICYSCLQVESFGFKSFQDFLTGGSPAIIFNQLLDHYRIRKADAVPNL